MENKKMITTVYEKPYVRIADELGVSRQAVRDMMGKAMCQMRKRYGEDAHGLLG